ncbi:MAG: DUF3108 domain-containing protein [Paucibacter sp.]|nr:DUF3108 domain-containing protein [Roseateles sp.]
MADRLTPSSRDAGSARPRWPAGPRRRWLLPAVLSVPVLVLHGCLGDAVGEMHERWTDMAEMPPRLSVSYVRELQHSRPSPAAAQAPVPPRPVRPPAQAVPPQALAASTPKPSPEPEPIQALEPAEPSPPSEPEASAPSPELAAAASAPEAAASALTPALAASDTRPAPEPDTPAFQPGPEWPPSTRLRYDLTGNYRGAVTGDAQVEWIREGSRYQVHLDVSVGPSFAPLISRRMSSDGQLTPQGIAPQRYDEDTRMLFNRRRVSVLFQGEQLTLANGRVEESAPGMQDAASQFVQLTWLFLTGRQTLREGLVLELPLALPRRQYRWRYEVLGRETLATPMGELDTWHLKPSVVAGGGDLTAEVWLAPTLQYLPVRLRIRQDEQTYIDLMLKAPPAQAAEGSPAPAPIVKPKIETPNPNFP